MFSAQRPYTPSPSPPSSPSLGPIDSSPPSSPGLGSLIIDSSPAHPFAASTKATKPPRQHEWRLGTSYFHETPTIRKYRVNTDPFDDEDDYMSDASLQDTSIVDPEKMAWDDAITSAVDTGNGSIELSGRGLTYIPSEINDLEKFYVPPIAPDRTISTTSPRRPFSRVATAPASTSLPSRSPQIERTISGFIESSVGLSRDEIRLFLAANQIQNLPRELFCLKKMTVLSLRGNQLTHLPPEIRELTNLRELNVGNNRITYLPSEMLAMSIKQLQLHPNPFLQEPTSPTPTRAGLTRSRSISRLFSRGGARTLARVLDPLDAHASRAKPAFSNTTHPYSRVPPLVEFTLRILLSPLPSDPSGDVALRALYVLPLVADDICLSEPLRDILYACSPGSVISSAPPLLQLTPRPPGRARKQVPVLGVGVCPSPSHTTHSRFVNPAEERFSWENTIAGCTVGGPVPVKWRGCAWGCLDFLGKEEVFKPNSEPVDTTPANAGIDDSDSASDDEAVQVIDLSTVQLDFDD